MKPHLFKIFFIFFFLAESLRAQTGVSETMDKLNIESIARDQFGRIWLGTSTGLYCYDGSQLIEFNAKYQKDVLSDIDIKGLVFNPVIKKLVATTAKGIDFFDPESFANQTIPTSKFELKNEKSGLFYPCVDKDGNTWCTDDNGALIKVDSSLNYKVISLKIPMDSLLIYKYGPRHFFKYLTCSKNQIYFGTSQSGVCKYDGKVSVLSADHRAVTGIFKYDKEVVISDFSGLHFKNESDTSLKSFLPAHLINFSFQDNNGEIWFVLNKIQLFKLNKYSQPELIYELNAEQINKHKFIKAILVDREKIWMGTERGLLTINKPFKAFQKIFNKLPGYSAVELSSRGIAMKNDSVIICAGYNYLASYHLFSNAVKSLVPKKDAQALIPYGLHVSGDSLWIASEGRGLRLFDLRALRLKKIEYHNPIVKNYFTENGLIRCVSKIDSLLYLGEYGQLGIYNLRSKKIVDSYSPYWNYPWARDETKEISQILEMNNNELLFVSNGRIFITDKQLNIIKKIIPERSDENVSALFVLNVLVDQKQRYWISTKGAGLCLYNFQTEACKWFTVDNGLCDNMVYYSLQSDDGRVWAATNYGLSVIDPVAGTINNYYEKDGLANNEFNTNSYLKTPNGDLYFGGMKGVTRIIPSLLKTDNRKEKFLLTAVNIAGAHGPDSLILANLNKLRSVNLPYYSRFLKVQFSLMNFSNRNKYAFRLLGMDSAWVDLGNNNSIIFNSLIPGSYTLQIKAWNERGEQVSDVINLPIESEQIFYKKLLFIMLLLLLFVGITGFVFYVIYKLKLKAVNQMADMRLKIATNLHDQVGGLLNKTAIQADLVQMKLTDKEKSLTKIADNSRVALSSMRDILWNLDPRNDNPESLVDLMREYAHNMLSESNSYQLNVSGLREVKLPHEVRQVINSVFKEAINNIVKHAGNEKVEVNVEVNGAGIKLSVYNSGNFVIKEGHTGQGMKNMKMRIEKIGGTFSLDTTEGVKLLFWIPLKKRRFT